MTTQSQPPSPTQPAGQGETVRDVARLDQSIADFKVFMQQRFDDQNIRLDERDRRQTDRLDERFKTQTTVLDAAFSAAEKARQEALSTAGAAAVRTENRIKDLENRLNAFGSRDLGRADVWGWVVGGSGLLGVIVVFLLR